jgi:hypothetical protein
MNIESGFYEQGAGAHPMTWCPLSHRQKKKRTERQELLVGTLFFCIFLQCSFHLSADVILSRPEIMLVVGDNLGGMLNQFRN